MQPGVTVVLATVWLAVYADVVGAANLYPSRLTLDQYSPLAPHRHGVYRKVEGQLDWKDQNPAENQPLDLSIGPRRSISADTESPNHSFGAKYLEKDLIFPRMGNSAVDDFSPLFEDKQFHNYDGRKFADEKVDGGGPKTPKLLSRELPPSELEDPFVADDTFQDQGPGSVEIYKLDLLREKPLLNPTPATRLLTKSKSKTPKKSGHVNWKVKTTEYRATSPKMKIHKQSNTFDDSSTELPPNSDPFSIGGVPELQVGCEGLEAFNHKQKRSIDPPANEKNSETGVDLWAEATPISLNVDYELSEEEGYEEMDELLKLRKLETTTMRTKHNRGDMEATLHLDFFEEKRRAEKLPVRGDLGKVKVTNESATLPATVPDNQRAEKGEDKGLRFGKAKRSVRGGSTADQSRKILWVDDSELENRSKRGAWGFGEDEGVVTSDELQTENQRRWKQEERRREEEARRRSRIENRTDYEREFERRRMEEEKRRRYESRHASPDEEERKRQRQLEENRSKELEKRKMREEERSRWEEATRMRQEQQELDRRREWMLKRNREEEERRRNESPPSSLYAMRASPNESRPDPETERRMREQQHRDREQKVREYVQHNRPINVNGSVDRRKEEAKKRLEEERRRLEEERKLQEYIRRNQPIHVHRANESNARYLLEHRRAMDSAGLNNRPRYPMPETGRRSHGPSAPTYVYPQSYPNRGLEEQRIREMERQEELKREAARREKEVRRIQSRRYEEQRRRQEAAKLEADRRIKELAEVESRGSQAGRTRPTENTRPVYEDRRRFDEQRRRQDASLIPVNLRLNESRRTMELERQRQEQQRRRIEAERRRQEESRTKEARENEERTRAMKEEWKRRQEEARLNALPVSARIIVQPGASSSPPVVLSRAGVNNDIDFSGINPNRQGLQVSNFPAPSTRWPPVRSPPLCVWAVVRCCPYNANRLVTCFESAGCPGVNWDPNPCRASIMRAATEQVTKFYAEAEENRHL